jgi:uncharacterized protein (TIGR00369 family)
MSIWKDTPDIPTLCALSKGNMGAHLDIQFTAIGDDFLTASMPVDHRTVQVYGILHGGASVVLAETVGSVAGSLCIDQEKYAIVGVEVNANHLRPVRSGRVYATARPIHLGRTMHVWDIDVHDEREKLVAKSRLTLNVIPKDKLGGR